MSDRTRQDRRFDEIVTSGSSIGVGEKERGYRALCADCGTYHTVRRKEFGKERDNPLGSGDGTFFSIPYDIETEELRYVAQMRAYNCCNEGTEPLDGFPETPDAVERHVE
jgi:hypothetical protein